MPNEPFGDNFIPVIPVDAFNHSEQTPFCWDSTCPCKEDQEAIAIVGQHVQDGLITPQEATDFVNGKAL